MIVDRSHVSVKSKQDGIYELKGKSPCGSNRKYGFLLNIEQIKDIHYEKERNQPVRYKVARHDGVGTLTGYALDTLDLNKFTHKFKRGKIRGVSVVRTMKVKASDGRAFWAAS